MVEEKGNVMVDSNPIIRADYPDPDIIRVEDTYYMVSTTMHFMPGCVILRSYDLVHWEVATHVYDTLDDTPSQRLEGELCIYGQGMWAASLRYHQGKFYVLFVANDTHKTYLYQAEHLDGPWRKQYVEGFYHDASLLFDDDDRVYIAYGNTDIYITELKPDFSGPKPGGFHRLVVKDRENVILGYEGSHLYKLNGKYYLFLIHWLADGTKRRVEACFVSDSLEGEFVGKNVLDDDMGYYNQGIAQGGIVDTPDGKWYAVLFQDRGAVGRIPVIVPVHWKDDFPVFGVDGKVPYQLEVQSTRPGYVYAPVVDSDDFVYSPDGTGKTQLKSFWQWNHIPDDNLWSVNEHPGHFRIRSQKLSRNVVQAVNTLTQRMMEPGCQASVTVDGSGLKDGDYAGICALQGCYGLIALTKDEGKYYLVMLAKVAQDNSPFGTRGDNEPGQEFARIPVVGDQIRLKLQSNFENRIDEVEFFYQDHDDWLKLGITHKLHFKLDHFVGCRVGLFLFSTRSSGGVADFSDFVYTVNVE